MTKKRPVTLKQVAARAEVSRTAASFALSGRPGVSEATRSKVQRIAAELGYSPNPTAQNLRTSRTGIVAVYLPDDVSTLSYYMEATFGIIDEAEQSGHTVTIIGHAQESTMIDRLRADGIIMLDPALGDPNIQRLQTLGLPIISGEDLPDPGAEAGKGIGSSLAHVAGLVNSDHASTTMEILDHFAEAGARLPAIITTSTRMAWSMAIENAYLRWCEGHGVAPRVEEAALDDLEATTREATRNLLSTGAVDAIFALTDGSVLNVLTSASEFGRTIGEDLLVAAAVDAPVLAYTDPAVTAVDLRPRAFGRECMALLRRVLDRESGGVEVEPGTQAATQPLTTSVPTQVIYRASTSPPIR